MYLVRPANRVSSADLLFTKPSVYSAGMGVVPRPAPVPLNIKQSPQAALLSNWLLLSARVSLAPFVQGRRFVFAKFWLKLQVPWSSWPAP